MIGRGSKYCRASASEFAPGDRMTLAVAVGSGWIVAQAAELEFASAAQTGPVLVWARRLAPAMAPFWMARSVAVARLPRPMNAAAIASSSTAAPGHPATERACFLSPRVGSLQFGWRS